MGDVFSLQRIVFYLVAFLIAVTVHEFAHARAALAAGDDTAKRMGRLSLNPIDHLDPMGTILFAGMLLMNSPFVFGWGKPVPVNPSAFKSPRWDSLKVSLWGPLSNLITAALLAVVMRFVPGYDPLLTIAILFNLVLAFFNLLPIAPLDGSKILSALLPVHLARRYELTMMRYGVIILVVLLFTRIASLLILPPVIFIFKLLLRLAGA